jgi:hypothetical protein
MDVTTLDVMHLCAAEPQASTTLITFTTIRRAGRSLRETAILLVWLSNRPVAVD